MNFIVAIFDNLVIHFIIWIVSSVNRVCIKWLSVRFCPDLAKPRNNKKFTWRLTFTKLFLHPYLMKMIQLHNWNYYYIVFNWQKSLLFSLNKQIHSPYLIHNTTAMGYKYKINRFTCNLILGKGFGFFCK